MDWRSTLGAECQPTGLLSGHQDSSMESSPPARTSRPALFITPPAATTYTKITNNLGQKLVNKTTTFNVCKRRSTTKSLQKNIQNMINDNNLK